jgi:hypothetical protein
MKALQAGIAGQTTGIFSDSASLGIDFFNYFD